MHTEIYQPIGDARTQYDLPNISICIIASSFFNKKVWLLIHVKMTTRAELSFVEDAFDIYDQEAFKICAPKSLNELQIQRFLRKGYWTCFFSDNVSAEYYKAAESQHCWTFCPAV